MQLPWVQPGIEANRSCSGVEYMEGKDLLALTSGAVNNPHCIKHLRYFFLPLLCKIQANWMTIKKTAIFSLLGLSLLAVCVVAALFLRQAQYHPFVVFRVAESLQVTFLQDKVTILSQCEANVSRVAQALRENCSSCRLLENRCVEKLTPIQGKILYGQPLDLPVLRTAGGSIAFDGEADLALQACVESERRTNPLLPGGTRCAPAAVESIALNLASINGKFSADAVPRLSMLFGLVLLASGIAFLVCYLIIISERLHGRFSNDGTETGPQKFHALPTPRIGGVALAAALAGSILAMILFGWMRPTAVEGVGLLALAATPAFLSGLGEDLTKKISVLMRLIFTISSAVVASLLVGATLDRLDVPGLDTLLQWPIFAIAFTAIAVGGITNAINIIDGYNGLAGGYAVIVLAALAFVSGQVGDSVMLTASLTMAGAVFGVLLWNYPKGKIFLGDGGAYLIGFWLAEISILLVARNPEVSPWFPMLLLAYPTFETLFTVYRRKVVLGSNPGHPDALHLHQLIYLQLVQISVGSRDPRDITRRNSAVARYIWAGTALFIVPSLLVWRNTPMLIGLTVLLCGAYTWLYLRLISRLTPVWLITSAKH